MGPVRTREFKKRMQMTSRSYVEREITSIVRSCKADIGSGHDRSAGCLHGYGQVGLLRRLVGVHADVQVPPNALGGFGGGVGPYGELTIGSDAPVGAEGVLAHKTWGGSERTH